MTYSKDQFLRDTDVSRETLDDYHHWHQALEKWNARINLVAPASLEAFWYRHALDSWQITQLLPPTARLCLDLGSGAGFPGLALAIHYKEQVRLAPLIPSTHITLTESVGKKVNFLRTLIRARQLPASVSPARIETLPPQSYDIITARAFAPLPRLLAYAAPFWGASTLGLFHKGENVSEELTAAQEMWHFDVESTKSLTDSHGVVLTIRHLKPKG